MTTVYIDTLRAIAKGDSAEAARRDSMIEDEARPEFHRRVTALFSLFLAETFEENASHDEVMRFVESVAYGYRNIDPPVKPLALEATVRGTLGEDQLLDEVEPEEQIRVMLLVIRAVAAQNERVQLHLDKFLMDADTLAREL